MDSLLKEINMLPGVFGCFVYTGNQELAAAKLPPIFKENTIKTMGNLLTRTIKMGTMANLNIEALEFKFDISLIILKPLEQGAILVMICEPAVNKSLINMTTSMLAQDIQAAINRGPVQAQAISQPTPPQPQHAPPPPAAPQPAPPEKKEPDIDAALAPVLENIKDALAYAIGPIAGQVMLDAIDTWAQEGATSKQTLPALATILCQEINDKRSENEFMAQIKSLL
jgi:predicted regulator of Ras-like GTPase activity (Roadblock/LC7/MglB family)